MKIDRDELLLYALDQLSPADQARVQAALDADPALQAEVQAHREAVSLLLDDLNLEAVTVPAHAEDRLLARVRAETEQLPAYPAPAATTELPEAGEGAFPMTPPSPRRTAWWLAVPLGLAAALALWFALRAPGDPAQQYARLPGAVVRTVTSGQETLGTLVRLPDGRVFVALKQAAPPGRTYQLWHIQGAQPVSLGVFGSAGLLSSPLPPNATVAVSVEPSGGSPQPTSKPLFAQSL